MTIKVKAIAAMAENRVIGNAGGIPWHLPEDMKHFAKLTTGHSVLMGSKTYWSLPEKFRPLPNRQNIVASRTPESLSSEKDIQVITDPLKFIEDCKSGEVQLESSELWIIGGAEIYSLTKSCWDELHLTVVQGAPEGDAFFPEFESQFTLSSSKKTDRADFRCYRI